jgi:hypothetical protein
MANITSAGTKIVDINALNTFLNEIKSRFKIGVDTNWDNITDTPNTLLGYGITDAVSDEEILDYAKKDEIGEIISTDENLYLTTDEIESICDTTV